MKIPKTVTFLSAHGSVVISLMMLTFAIINTMNNAMEFLIGSMTRTLMIFWAIFLLAAGVTLFLTAKLKAHKALALLQTVWALAFAGLWIYNRLNINEQFFDTFFAEVFIMALAIYSMLVAGVMLYNGRHGESK